MNQKKMFDQIHQLMQWLNKFEDEVAKTKTLAAIAAGTDFSNYDKDLQTDYWNIFFTMVQHMEKSFKNIGDECRRLYAPAKVSE